MNGGRNNQTHALVRSRTLVAFYSNLLVTGLTTMWLYGYDLFTLFGFGHLTHLLLGVATAKWSNGIRLEGWTSDQNQGIIAPTDFLGKCLPTWRLEVTWLPPGRISISRRTSWPLYTLPNFCCLFSNIA